MLSDGAESQGREERQRRKDVDHEGHDDAEADVVGLQMDSFMRFLHSRDQAMASWSTMAR